MLQTQTLSTELLGIIRYLMQQPDLKEYRLVGGTALALQIGHRKSIDIDLFGEAEVSGDKILELLNQYGKAVPVSRSKNINIFLLDGIKIDFVRYRYPWIEECIVEDAIRMASPADIGAMKINAITGRGSRKDFIDLYYLLKKYSLSEILGFFQKKYADGSMFLALKSLCYFKDADHQQPPFLFENISWPDMKQAILNEYKKIV